MIDPFPCTAGALVRCSATLLVAFVSLAAAAPPGREPPLLSQAAAATATLPTVEATQAPPDTATVPAAAKGRARDDRAVLRGFCVDAPRRGFAASDLDAVAATGADWISITPFAWQSDIHDPHVGFNPSPASGHMIWGETDTGLEAVTRAAHARGLSVLLSPHIWMHAGDSGKWRGDIEMLSEEDWRAWFDDYRRFILHHAQLARRLDIEMLSVGLELRRAATTRESDWRDLIKAVRTVYPGALTYSANWYAEPEEIRFWDVLDYIGVQAYFPLGADPAPDLATLLAAWPVHRDRLARLARRTGKPILFTEIGYKSSRGSTVDPWTWGAQGKPDLALQARAYRAVLETFRDEPWFAGFFFWKWHPGLAPGSSRHGGDFTPQHKPAMAVIEEYFRPR